MLNITVIRTKPCSLPLHSFSQGEGESLMSTGWMRSFSQWWVYLLFCNCLAIIIQNMIAYLIYFGTPTWKPIRFQTEFMNTFISLLFCNPLNIDHMGLPSHFHFHPKLDWKRKTLSNTTLQTRNQEQMWIQVSQFTYIILNSILNLNNFKMCEPTSTWDILGVQVHGS